MAVPERERLHRTLKEYTARAMETLAATCPEAPPEMIFRGFAREWTRITPGLFGLRERAVPYWELCILERAQDRRAFLSTRPSSLRFGLMSLRLRRGALRRF